MFNADFFPTPLSVIEQMTAGLEMAGKTILEPSAGSGAIVDFLQLNGANVLACETDERLQKIVQTKCKLLAADFLTVTSDQVSHISAVVMNPPFSKGAEHLLHAYSIAPKGCKVVCLLNQETLSNPFSRIRQELTGIIEAHGFYTELGDCFKDAERKTFVHVAMVVLNKPGETYANEFEGFFLEDDPEEHQENALMSYNAVRDVVHRYISAVKLYDKQLELAAQMNDITHEVFFRGLTKLSMSVTRNSIPVERNEFKKSMQKAGWNWIFDKMDLRKHSTRGLREDINKFVEDQQNIPFTMRNIYKMLEIVVGTTSQRMDKAIIEAFDNITLHHADNRFNVKGWKTNSHFLVGKKFILPNCVRSAKEYSWVNKDYTSMSGKKEIIEDFEKALCFTNAINYDEIAPRYSYLERTTREAKDSCLNDSIRNNIYGEWYESFFFKYKAFKNGNMHFEFKDENVWAKFNQHVSRIKGYPLFEAKEQTVYQKRQTGRVKNPAMNVLFEMDI